MPTRFLVLETPLFSPPLADFPGTARADAKAFTALLGQHQLGSTQDHLFVVAPAELRFQTGSEESTQGPNSISLAFFARAQDAERFFPSLVQLASDSRSLGIKECLQPGSTIYSESFFSAAKIGERLDPCLQFARQCLSLSQAINVWACLEALVLFGLQQLPELGEKGSGERVDSQLGVDKKLLTLTVRFDLPKEKLASARSHPLLSLARFAASVFEARYIQSSGKLELNCLFYRGESPEAAIELITYHRETALENPTLAQAYAFKTFGNLPKEGTEKPASKGNFKRKLSKQMQDAPALAEDVSSLLPLLQSKIENLETTIKQRDELVTKLNKEIMEIKDPLNKEVISGSKDNPLKEQLEEQKRLTKELSNRITNLTTQLQEAGLRPAA